MMNSSITVSPSTRPQVQVPVDVKYSAYVDHMAKRASTVVWQALGSHLGVTAEDLEQFHLHSLRCAIGKMINTNLNIGQAVLPSYFEPLYMMLSCKIGRSIIRPSFSDEIGQLPAGYSDVKFALKGMGIVLNRMSEPLRVSKALGFCMEDIDGALTIVGPMVNDFTVEDLVLRGLLEVSQADNDKLRAILGDLSAEYAVYDELFDDWLSSTVRNVVIPLRKE